MRRMLSDADFIGKPKLVFEKELINESSVNFKMEAGYYLIELHDAKSVNMAILHVNEDPMCISTATMFNPTIVGAGIGFYEYDAVGNLLEIFDGTENNITVNGHLDIYKF